MCQIQLIQSLRLTQRRALPAVLLLSILAWSVPGLVQAESNPCELAMPGVLSGNFRGYLGDPGEGQFFELLVSQPGVLIVDVAVTGPRSREARLNVLDGNCSSVNAVDSSITPLFETASSRMMRIDVPGSYFFVVAPQDSTLALGEYRLRTAFSTIDPSRGPRLEPQETAGTSCDPTTDSNCVRTSDKTEDVSDEVLPPPKAPHRWPPVADPVRQGVALGEAGIGAAVANFCRLEAADDHGDSPFCATPLVLGEGVAGELENPWGDDQDFFKFMLEAPTTVTIESNGTVDTYVGLYDQRGYRLALDDNGGRDRNFRIVKTLMPGVYFIRVENAAGPTGAAEIYRLTLDWEDGAGF